MIVDEFYVEQTLHGYSNGHRLLQASSKLSEQDSKKMMILSDLSGNEFVNGFERYFTGYNLDNNHIVLACTWYAEEMKRPGCVWTHSLIFDVKDLYLASEDITSIIAMFKKPDKDSDFLSYSNPLKFERSSNEELDENNLKYLIWCVWGNRRPLIIFDDVSTNFEKEMIFLFLAQHDLLEEDFSFCTGSVALRVYGGKTLQLQIVPRKISRSKLHIGEKTYEAKDKNVIKNYPLWVNKMFDNLKKNGLKKYRKFVAGFSKDYKQPMYVSAFMKLYVGSRADEKEASLVTLLEMACAIFEDKKKICNEILTLYSKNYFSSWCGKEDYNEVLDYFINNRWLDISSIDFRRMLREGYISDYTGSQRLLKNIIKGEENSLNEVLLKAYTDIIPNNQFVDFTGLEYDCCSTLISIKNEFAICQEIWRRSKGYQQGIIRCLSRKEERLDKKIIQIVLQTSEYDLSYDLYRVYEKECIQVYWDYLLDNRESKKVKGIIDIVKDDTESEVKLILCYLTERDTLLFLVSLVDPYDKEIQRLSKEDVNRIYNTIIENNCDETEKEILAKFLLPICILEDYMLETEIAKFSFDIVNGLLATQNFPENEWDKLEKILPEVAYYNNWDRCKRLRKGFRKKGYTFIEKSEEEELPTYLL